MMVITRMEAGAAEEDIVVDIQNTMMKYDDLICIHTFSISSLLNHFISPSSTNELPSMAWWQSGLMR